MTTPSPRRILLYEGFTKGEPCPFDEPQLDMIFWSKGDVTWFNVEGYITRLKREYLTDADRALASIIDQQNAPFYAEHLESLGLVSIERQDALDRRMYPKLNEVAEHVVALTNTEVGRTFLEACNIRNVAASRPS